MSHELRVMIVDDEPMAHQVLEEYCNRVTGLRVVEKCFDGLAAFNCLRTLEVDLILLDVQMPELTGLELLDSLDKSSPKVILTTAHTRYAVEGFDYDSVIDYLHKPIRLTRFIKAIGRVRNTLRLERGKVEIAENASPGFLLVEIDNRSERIPLADIHHVQAWGNYVRIQLDSGKQLTVRRTLKSLENELPSGQFLRIHKSYIVQVSHVSAIDTHEITLGVVRLPLGKSYRQLARRVVFGKG